MAAAGAAGAGRTLLAAQGVRPPASFLPSPASASLREPHLTSPLSPHPLSSLSSHTFPTFLPSHTPTHAPLTGAHLGPLELGHVSTRRSRGRQAGTGARHVSPVAALSVTPSPGGTSTRTSSSNGSSNGYAMQEFEYEYEDSSAPRYMQETDTFSKYSGYIQEATAGVGADWDRYDPVEMGKYFRGRPILVARRLAQIGGVLSLWLGKRWLDSKTGRAEENFKMRAGQLRAALQELGPAFVKIAQAVSSRPDVVPPAYLEQLSLLQDRIAPFSTAEALDIVESELGVPMASLFSEISPQPVAAASLGQVYQARLAATGQAVALKVQRPGVRAAIALDIYILRILAGWVRQYRQLNTDLEAVVDEWASSLFLEMDYEAEARNGARFRDLFGSQPGVVIPRMYPELSTKRVLLMEWIDGERLSQVRDTKLVEIGVEFSLTQLLDSGFYHADPHPGNLLRTPDGKLAYLDFGMMGEMDVDVREALIRACVHLVNREWEPLAEDFVDLQLLPRGQETSQVASALTSVFRDAISAGVRNLKFGDLGAELGRTMYRFKFRIPPYFSLVVRSLTVLEGIALRSNPNYKILASSYPWIARKVLTDTSPQLRATLKQLLYTDGHLRIDRLESLLQESTKRPATDGGAVTPFGSAQGEDAGPSEEEKQRTRKRVLSFALSEDGGFIRDLLLEEVAKGVDAWARMALDAAIDQAEESIPQAALSFVPPIPLLADGEEDLEHADNLRKLVALVSKPQGSTGPLSGTPLASQPGAAAPGVPPFVFPSFPFEDPGAALKQVGEVVSQIPTAANLFLELPPQAQQQALLLPADLATRVFSRALARTIRQAANLTSSFTE